MRLPARPTIYEINTAVWLERLGREGGRALTLAEVPAAAFAAFERARRGRVEPVVRQSRRTGRQKAPTGWIGRTIRDLVLPMFLRQAAEGARELYRYQLPAWEPTSPAAQS